MVTLAHILPGSTILVGIAAKINGPVFILNIP